MLWSGLNIETINAQVRVPLRTEDSLLICVLDTRESFTGWAAPWIWDWLNAKRAEALRQSAPLSNLYGSNALMGGLKPPKLP